MMKIINECKMFTHAQLELIEKKYNGKFIFESCIKDKRGNWNNFPASIFYTEEPHPEGSNYFAIWFDDTGCVMISNGISAIEPFHAIMVDETIYYSRYRHDCRDYGDFFIDGGRDYTRSGGSRFKDIKSCTLKVEKDKLTVYNDQH